MVKKKTVAKSETFEAMEVFQRPRWVHGSRVFGVVIMVTLNVSLVMSNVERLNNHFKFNIAHELLTYFALLIIDVFMLLPIIFEVDKATVQDSTLTLKTLFWTAKIPWSDIVSLKTPAMLKFAILRSPRKQYIYTVL